MNEPDPPVGDDDLHAFVDGQLDPARLDAVLAHLAAQPDDALRVAQWHGQRLWLRQRHRGLELAPAPEAMARRVMQAAHRPQQRRTAWAQAAAAVVVLGVGLGLGALGGQWSASRQSAGALAASPAPAFVRDAALAHAAFSPEIRHPVEVAAADQAHLVQWLSRRLGQPLKAPLLLDRGFSLLGGRLLPGDPTPRAQFMYEDARGRRVTLYVTVFPPDKAPAETAFRSVREGNLESFYWVEGAPVPAAAQQASGGGPRDLGVAQRPPESRFGYALAAELPSADLQVLARDVYAQLSR
jgi:anti-sigma factor RsiW